MATLVFLVILKATSRGEFDRLDRVAYTQSPTKSIPSILRVKQPSHQDRWLKIYDQIETSLRLQGGGPKEVKVFEDKVFSEYERAPPDIALRLEQHLRTIRSALALGLPESIESLKARLALAVELFPQSSGSR